MYCMRSSISPIGVFEKTRVLLTLLMGCSSVMAQSLEPRSYSVSPTGVNIVVVGQAYATGDLNFDPSLPIDNGSAQINNSVLGYFRSVNVLGRSANVSVALPYAWGKLQGNYLGEYMQISRSGLMDFQTRFAINLYGAKAMKLKDFAGHRQRTLIGASVVVVAPTGQYDPAKVINIGNNRWAFRPEVGISQSLKRIPLSLEGHIAVWLYTANNNFQRGMTRTQAPIFSNQFHAVYDINKRIWVAGDATYYVGGRTAINGVERDDLQSNSRYGATAAFRLTRRHSFKLAYSAGARTTIGGNFRSVGLSYQYLWGAGL